MTAIRIGGRSYEPNEIVDRAKRARGWFAAIAGFSLVNSLLIMLGTQVSFVIGLGATQVVDGMVAVMREEVGASSAAMLSAIGLLINLCIVGVVMVIWWASGRGSTAAYLAGMALYGLDGLLFVLVRDWLGVAFHVFFLIMLWSSYRFMRERRTAEAFLKHESPMPPPETYVAPTA